MQTVEGSEGSNQVVFSNIKFGDINSTFSNTGSSSTTTTGSSTTTSPPTNTGGAVSFPLSLLDV